MNYNINKVNEEMCKKYSYIPMSTTSSAVDENILLTNLENRELSTTDKQNNYYQHNSSEELVSSIEEQLKKPNINRKYRKWILILTLFINVIYIINF